MKTVIIGGVAGGATAAARLRRLDESAEIIMFERGAYISFANCGLPYYIGGEITDADDLAIQTPESFNARYNVDVRIMNEAVSIDKDKKTVGVKNLVTGETYVEDFDALILSTGASPIVPNIDGAAGENVFTLRTIPDTYKIKAFIEKNRPKTAVVIGGGYIGVEMAENLAKAGIGVTVVELSDQVIAPLDYDMACSVHSYLRQKGVKLILNDGVKGIRETGSCLTVALNGGELRCEMLIMAVGVRPESALAKSAGLGVNERGAIIVNEHMQTTAPDIYAVGDAVETADFVTGLKAVVALAGPANKQARVAADNICGINSAYNGAQGSAILRIFDMTAAMTGVNEKTAKRLGLDYDKSFTFSSSHASYYPGAEEMSVKIIFEKKTGKLLGAQIIGFDGADKRCDVIAAAIRAGMTARDLTDLELCYAPPFSSAKDPVNIAGYVIENLLDGRVKNFHWHDVSDLQKDGGATLLDVRTEDEYSDGHIGGFINIPVDDLRGRLNELDKTKKIYVTCRVGARGYVACRILTQNGFDAYNLSGGYRLYESVFNA